MSKKVFGAGPCLPLLVALVAQGQSHTISSCVPGGLLSDRLRPVVALKEKGEFEDERAYRGRRARAVSSLLGRRVALRAPELEASLKYNADKERFEFPLERENGLSIEEEDRSKAIVLERHSQSVGRYRAQNPFGAQFLVDRRMEDCYGLILEGSFSSGTMHVPLAAKLAPTLKSRIRVVCVVDVDSDADRIYIRSDKETPPSFSNPTESLQRYRLLRAHLASVCVSDANSGRVLATFDEPHFISFD